jgi:two-component system sensor histidine kinase QseC
MNSIRRQLTRRMVLVLAILLGVGLTAISVVIWQALGRSFDAALRTRALAVAALTEVETGRVQFDFSPDFLRGFGAEHPRSYFEIRDAAGTVLARSPSLRGSRLAFPSGGTPGRPLFRNLHLPNGRPARAAGFSFIPVPSDNSAATLSGPTVRLVVALDRVDFDETLGGLLAAVAGCGGLLFVGVLLFVPRVLRTGLAPLDQLGEQAARIDAGSLASRFPIAGLPAELRPIGDRLNDLLVRLEAAFERERRFSADLAHELRTPIAELRSLAECALKWPDARDPAADRDALAIATQMEALVTRMLTLARGERGQLPASRGPVEVAEVAGQAWRPFAARAAERNLRVTLELAPSAVPADGVLLRSILANLFGNAVDFAPAGSEIHISGEAAAAGYVLRVANPAGGLAGADVARLFDRFWRKEEARTGGEHFGLGLSLARVFAQAMDWRLSAELDARGWIVFALTAEGAVGGAKPEQKTIAVPS